MDIVDSPRGYSPRVKLRMIIGQDVFPLASLGAQRCRSRFALPELPESDAELIVDVDGDVARYHVRLIDGVRAGAREFRFWCYGPTQAKVADVA